MNEKKVREAIVELKTLAFIAKKTLALIPEYAKEYDSEIKALETAIEALEKQLPRKPNFEGDGYAPNGTFVYDTWICPSCEGYYEVDYDDYVYCPQCGQKLDWSE